MSSKSYLLSN